MHMRGNGWIPFLQPNTAMVPVLMQRNVSDGLVCGTYRVVIGCVRSNRLFSVSSALVINSN